MKRVTIPIARRLIGARAVPSISIYVNADDRSPGGREDLLRLRRLLRRTSRFLEPALGRRAVDALLTPIAKRAREPWPAARSVGFLRSPETSASLALPMNVPELAIVSSTFHTKPLVSALDGGHRFALLAVGHNVARLYEGDTRRLRHVDDAMPAAFARSTGDRRGWRPTVDGYLSWYLRNTGAPVVLAGARRQVEAFRSTSRYPWIADEVIECDLEQVHVEDLHAPALEIVQAHRAEREGEAAARYATAAATGTGTDDLVAVARAAVTGRVLLLVHRRGAHVWGSLDRLSGAIVVPDGAPGPGDADVIDDLCEVVLQRGGDVVEIAPERMPCERPVGAVTRPALRVPRTVRSLLRARRSAGPTTTSRDEDYAPDSWVTARIVSATLLPVGSRHSMV